MGDRINSFVNNQPRAPTRTASDNSSESFAGATVLSGEDGEIRLGRGNAEESWSALVQSHTNGHVSHMSALDSPLSPGPGVAISSNAKKAIRPGMTTRPSQLYMSHIPPLSSTTSDPESERGGSYFPAPQLTRELYFPPRLSPSASSQPDTSLCTSAFEEERRRVVKRFGLDAAGRKESIDRCAAVARSHFKCQTVIISLALDDKQIVAAEIGMESEASPNSNAPLRELPLDADALRRLAEEDFIVEDAQVDEKEKLESSQTFGPADGSITFFASATIYLPTAFPDLPLPLASKLVSPKPPPLLPVGSISILDRGERVQEAFSEQDRMVLKSLADMIAREFRLGFEQQRRETEARQALFLGQMLRTSLVNPGRSNKVLHNVSGPETKQSNHAFEDAAQALQSLTGADTTVILDLRAFHAPFAPDLFVQLVATLAGRPTGLNVSPDVPTTTSFPTPVDEEEEELEPPEAVSTMPPAMESRLPAVAHSSTIDSSEGGSSVAGGFTGEASRWGARFSGVAPGAGVITVLGSGGAYDWDAAVLAPGCKPAVSHSLVAFYSDQMCEFDSGTVPSPLSDFLPPNTEASLSVPVFDHDGRPSLLLILCSFTKYFRFEPTDRAFVENVGAVCVGSLMRRRILEADRAKLAFVSQISHELRTPLHSIGSQIELIREVSSPSTLVKLKPLLDTADVCIASLREVLDDTLEFAKMSNQVGSTAEAERHLTPVSLERLVEEVAKSSWTRTRQNADIISGGDSIKLGMTGAGEKVDVILEVDRRFDDWLAMVDVGGMKRVLLNVLGNSLKFTSTGSITLQVYDLPVAALRSEAASGVRMVGIAIKDTGMGMSADEDLFIPFKQHSTFSNGAGLGVSSKRFVQSCAPTRPAQRLTISAVKVCDNIVKRMHGTLQYESVLGKGTIARIAVPLRLVPANSRRDSRGHPTIQRPFPINSLGPPRTRIISEELKSMLNPTTIMADGEKAAALESKKRDTSPQRVIGRADVRPLPLPILDPSTPLTGFDGTLRCLVVDDNRIARRILTTFLVAKGVLFAEAENGIEAIERFKSFRPNLDGIAASKLIREFEAQNSLWPAYMVALTGLSSESRLHKDSLASGHFDEWLVKGGPSLKILGAGLVRRQKELDVLSLRIKAAAQLNSAAQAILRGIAPAVLYAPDELLPLELVPATEDYTADMSEC
ncbi:hypothetical protein P7C70_g5222, partial [Phenoliferia sp. Uapishka_3]